MKQMIFGHAFVSPFEMMGMLTTGNDEKEARYRIRVGSAGKIVAYATINVMMEASRGQIANQMSANEIDEEDKLLGSYASKISMPTFAYLGRSGFKN